MHFKCTVPNCNSKGYIKLLFSKEKGFPYSDVNIIKVDKSLNDIDFDEHNYPINLHKYYIKKYIDYNFSIIDKKDLFRKEYDDKYTNQKNLGFIY